MITVRNDLPEYCENCKHMVLRHKGIDRDGYIFSCVHLDKCQRIFNKYVKEDHPYEPSEAARWSLGG